MSAQKKVAILISGGGSNMVALLESMSEPGHPARPCLVLSNNPESAGLRKAEERGVPIAFVDHRPFGNDRPAFEAALVDAIEAQDADIVCLAGFMRVLTPFFVDRFAGRMLNIHPSLLPEFRGLHTHVRAISAGEQVHGCTVHEVTAELDDGPILGQGRVPVLPEDTPEQLAERVLEMEHHLYPAVLRRFAVGDKTPVHLGESRGVSKGGSVD